MRFHRTRGGHRRIPIAEAVRFARETASEILRPDLLGFVEGIERSIPADSYADRLMAALREGHAAAVMGLLQAMYADGMTVAEMCDGPMKSAMSVLGEAWPQDLRSIFVEHRASMLCVSALCQLGLVLPEPRQEQHGITGRRTAGGSLSDTQRNGLGRFA